MEAKWDIDLCQTSRYIYPYGELWIYRITGYAVMEILSVVGSLVQHHRGDESLSTRAEEDERRVI